MIELIKNEKENYTRVANFPLFRNMVKGSNLEGLDYKECNGYMYITNNSLEYLIKYFYKSKVFMGENAKVFERWGVKNVGDITEKVIPALSAIQDILMRGETI